MKGPLVTAVICTRNRADFLEKCIISLQQQTAQDEDYEILVVDNGSTDDTADVVQRFLSSSMVRYLYEPVAGLSRARNTGWKNAKGLYVGYIDDDAVVSESWIASVLWVFTTISPRPNWVGGPIGLEWEEPRPGWIDEELSVPLGYLNWGTEPRRLTTQERLGGGNSIYPREGLEAIGGFDERLGRGKNGLLSGEETQLQKRVEARGGFLYYHPGITIHHWVGRERLQPTWFYRRYFWGGVSDFVMNKTLMAETGPREEINPGSPSAIEKGRWKRLLSNLGHSMGIFSSKSQVIHGRIYLAYVLGHLLGMYRWFLWTKND